MRPFSVREGNIIKDGMHELDEIRRIMKSGTDYLLEIEAREREKEGIKNMKSNTIKFLVSLFYRDNKV